MRELDIQEIYDINGGVWNTQNVLQNLVFGTAACIMLGASTPVAIAVGVAYVLLDGIDDD